MTGLRQPDPDDVPDDIETASAARVAARIEEARQRRTRRDDFHQDHLRRRVHGNRARHAQKLARTVGTSNDNESDHQS